MVYKERPDRKFSQRARAWQVRRCVNPGSGKCDVLPASRVVMAMCGEYRSGNKSQ